MGGHITFQMSKFLKNIDYLIPIIGAPDLKRHYQEAKFSLLSDSQQQVLCPWFDKLLLTPNDLSKSSQMLILEGEVDAVVNWRNALDFYNLLQTSGFHHVLFESFPVGHQVTTEMESKVTDFLSGFNL